MNQQPTNPDDSQRIDAIASHIQSIISLLGEDPNRQGLLKTPQRAAKALYYLTSGYRSDAQATMSQALFDHEGSQIVSVRDIEFYSMCEHHLLPFIGKAHIAYIPSDGRIIGLSKLARIVNTYARRPQVQERLTAQIADFLYNELQAKSVVVVVEAEHLCMTMRGARAAGALTKTSALRGYARNDAKTRAEAMSLIFGGK